MTASPLPEHGVLRNARADADSHCVAGASEIAIDVLRPCSDLPPTAGPVTSTSGPFSEAPRMKTLATAAAVVSIAVLVACGGGGGGKVPRARPTRRMCSIRRPIHRIRRQRPSSCRKRSNSNSRPRLAFQAKHFVRDVRVIFRYPTSIAVSVRCWSASCIDADRAVVDTEFLYPLSTVRRWEVETAAMAPCSR